jgi:hypothetical protein
MITGAVSQVFERLPLRRVTALGHTPGQDNWDVLISIPANQFVLGREYVFVVTGFAGATLIPLPLTGPRQDDALIRIVPVSAAGIGFDYAFQVNAHHDPIWQDSSARVGASQTPKPTGYSFAIMHRVDWTAATTYEVWGQIKWNSPLSDPTRRGTFAVEGLTVQVWDLNELSAKSVPFVWSENPNPVVYPAQNQPVVTATSISHAEDGDWLCYEHVRTEPKFENNPCLHFTDRTDNTQFYTTRFQLRPHTLGLSGQTFLNTHPLARARVFTMPTNWTMRLRLAEGQSIGPYAVAHKSSLFAVKTTAAMRVQRTPGTSSALEFWGRDAVGWAGTPAEMAVTPDYYYVAAAIAQVDTDIVDTNGAAWRTRIDVDGAAIHRQPLSVPVLPMENLPQLRICNLTFLAVNETQWIGLRGANDWRPNLATFPLPANNPQLTTLNTRLSSIPFPISPPTPGPEVDFLVPYETAVPVLSLPALPIEPSFQYVVESEVILREFQLRRGYRITHPKQDDPVRVYRLAWNALAEADATALIDWFDALPATEGAFQWTPVGALSPRAFAPMSETLAGETAGARRSVTIDVAELRRPAP